ncbi:prepilin-type N-terminal cleavage/methylation domain-containing protein [Pseudomonas sp. CCC2.2]|uniref:PilW family protein n=1 Tax=Pseudomonas sp. CCC2.2 TaxID=3048605 RepID=UPI002B22E328|nr:prepilin-type N-terminal cleavage/methylation domain-containing protein [Pseudomonas sp. CCC2.2]MEB0150626.1 prepilin-type N-terminal cleavage/methylation domain-containing protein [Pseudomonas sp. CCC2.2]
MSRRQDGFTLISLMVGMVISLVSILAMLSLYKNLVHSSVVSTQSARQDGQVASGLLMAQRALMNAGFWMGSSTTRASTDVDNNFVLLSGATLSNGRLSGTQITQATLPLLTTFATAGVSANAIVWSYQTSTSTATATCSGLVVSNGALISLKGAAGCTQASSQWTATTWTSTVLIEAGQVSPFFSVGFATCWPYERTTDASNTAYRLQITMIANNSTLDPNSPNAQPAYVTSKSTACLINLEKST